MIAPLPSRWRRWRWGAGILAGIVLILLIVAWSQTTIRLPSGAVIVVDHVTYGSDHESKPRLLAKAANLLWDHRVGGMRSGMECDTVGIWMTCRTDWLHHPTHFDDVFQVVLIDRDGWPYGPAGFEEYERTWDGSYVSTGQRVNLDAMRRGSTVASFVICPLIRPPGSEATVAAVDAQGHVLGSARISYPGSPPPESTWTPDPLPSTRTDGNLSVTLHEVEFGPPPENAKPGAVRGVSVLPKFEVSWKGTACDDCQVVTSDEYLGAVHSPLSEYGQRIDSNSACLLSPFEPAWEWRFFFFPGRTADFDAGDVWHSEELTIPDPGELKTVEHRGQIGDSEYGIEFIGGPGEHVIDVPVGQRISLHQGMTEDGSSSFSGRQMRDAGVGTYDVKSDVPLLVVSSPPDIINEDYTGTLPFHALVRNSAGELIDSNIHMLSSVQWTHQMPEGIDDPREYWIVFLQPGEHAVDRLHVTFAQYRYTNVSFHIRPPELDFYRQHNLLPATLDLLSDQ